MANIQGKIPPHSLEAEESVLCSILIDKEAIFKVLDILKSEDFYKPSHTIIYETILELLNTNESYDFVSLGNKLYSKKLLEKAGGRSYLSSLSAKHPTSAHIKQHAKIIQKKSVLRRILSSASTLTELGHKEDEKIESIVDTVENIVYEISQKVHTSSFVSINPLLTEAFNRLDDIHKNKGKLRGLPTNFIDLDFKLSGLQKSDLIVIAARPSVGKTSLALDIARKVALLDKVPVAIFSLEMSKDQLVDRMICAEAGIDLWKLRTGNLTDKGENDDFTKISRALGELSEASIFIDDDAITNVLSIKSKARRLQMEKGLGLIIIDYLQLMEGTGNEDSRTQEVAKITRALKGIARELDVPVVALSQLSRAVEMGGGPAFPKLAHLRESGSIEQDADVVMFIYRKTADSYFKNKDLTPQEEKIAEINIAKHRNGPTGTVKLYWNKESATFENLTEDRLPESYETVAS